MRGGRLLAAASLLGASSGMRTLTPAAILATQGRLTGIRPIRTAVVLAAAGELVADKLPGTPSRTMPIALIGRMATGGVCGLVVGGPLGAAVATVTAGGATFLAHDARAAAVKRTRLPDLPFALIEDALTVSVALAGARLAHLTTAAARPS